MRLRIILQKNTKNEDATPLLFIYINSSQEPYWGYSWTEVKNSCFFRMLDHTDNNLIENISKESVPIIKIFQSQI